MLTISSKGYLWQTGYKSGLYTTPLFLDVPLKLQAWHDANIKLAIYSSGSVFAQQLFFEHVQGEQGEVMRLDIRLIACGVKTDQEKARQPIYVT